MFEVVLLIGDASQTVRTRQHRKEAYQSLMGASIQWVGCETQQTILRASHFRNYTCARGVTTDAQAIKKFEERRMGAARPASLWLYSPPADRAARLIQVYYSPCVCAKWS